jgi:hypothetical protein
VTRRDDDGVGARTEDVRTGELSWTGGAPWRPNASWPKACETSRELDWVKRMNVVNDSGHQLAADANRVASQEWETSSDTGMRTCLAGKTAQMQHQLPSLSLW